MRTGEGKTLVATLPLYLNALAGKGVHLVTVNDYLATRDAEWMGRIYRFLGLTVGVIVNGLSQAERQRAYAADITYGTNNEFGFDYLRDNLVYDAAEMVQRGAPLRDRRRGRLDPDRRGAHAADHLRPDRGPLGVLPHHRPAGARADQGSRRPSSTTRSSARRCSPSTARRRSRRCWRQAGHLARRLGRPLRPGQHLGRPPRQPGAARQRALPARPRLHRPRRRGDADRRVHRPDDARPAAVGGPAPGDRGQGRRRHPAREPDPGLGHHPELLPPLQEALRHDRHGGHRGAGVRRHLQDGRGRDPDQPAGDAASTTTTRSIAPPPRRTRRSSPRSRTATGAASRSWWARSRSRSPSSSRSCSRRTVSSTDGKTHDRHAAQRAERPLPRAGSLHRRRRRRARLGDHRHQHGRPRHRHPARRQPRHAHGQVARTSRAGSASSSTPEAEAERARVASRPRSRASGPRRWPRAASSCSAPSATRAGGSTTSCAAAPAARATRAARSSSSPARTTSCASSPATGSTRSCAPSASRKARRSPTSG